MSQNATPLKQHIEETLVTYGRIMQRVSPEHSLTNKAFKDAQTALLKEIEEYIRSCKPEKGVLRGRGYVGHNKRRGQSTGVRIVGAWDDALEEYQARLIEGLE